jgi:octaprenyl-diphosphate synthase
LSSNVPTLSELSKNLVLAGGKRLRPALVILSAQAVSEDVSEHRLTTIAATVELIHMASLVHDDVIDHSNSRRGRVTANAFWGNKISVLSGDFMLSKAFSFLSNDADDRILRVLSDMTIRMSESEVLQALCEHDVDGWKKHYWQIIRHKTAGFLSACCRCGAILAGASEDAEQALTDYGMELGLAFQLTDDLLDVTGKPEITGKPVGSDLKEGKVTLPVLLALDKMPEPERMRACSLIESSEITEEQVTELCKAICSNGAVSMTRDQAKDFTERAVAALDRLPQSNASEGLAALASQIIYRIS